MPPVQKKSARKQDVELDSLAHVMGNKPPQATDVEEAVLGAMLLEAACIDIAMQELKADCFYDPKLRMVFESISELVNEHTAVDIITCSAKLKQKGQLEDVGGVIRLSGLTEKVGSAAHIEYYLKILRQKAIQRDLISACNEILKDSFDDTVNVDGLIDMAQSKVYDAVQRNVKKDIQDILSVFNEAITDIQKHQGETGVTGVPSGYSKIDSITMGWQPSDLVILAARPSVGKTAFALNIARNAAVDHHMGVAVFSLEMSSVQLVKRLIVSESGLEADKIKGGKMMTDAEWQQLEVKTRALSKAPIYIDDTPSIHLMEFRTKVKNLVKNKGVRLVIVDYLQLMQGPSELAGMREQEVAAISRGLKATAKELNIPIIALSQLSRASVTRTGGTGKPQLSDLRESGSIEQDADMVIFIHRPDYIGMSENQEDREKTQIIIAKHRNGETADIDMVFKSGKVRFEEADTVFYEAQAAGMPIASGMNSMPSPIDDFENPAF